MQGLRGKCGLWTVAGITTFISGCSMDVSKENGRPNIIFIMSDDHAYQAISAYGGYLAKLAPTPNIDRIAMSGMLFERCMVTNSICGPSRATILTGKYSHLNGFIANEAKPFDGNQQTFPKLLQKAGYQTAVIGKWHLESNPTGFDYWDILPGQGVYYNPDFIKDSGKCREKGYVTEIITRKSLDWISRARDKSPFMLMIHHKAPHRNWEPGPRELGMYHHLLFPEPTTLFDDYANRGIAERSQDMTISKTMNLKSDLKIDRNYPIARFSPDQTLAWKAVYDSVIAAFVKSEPKGDDLTRFKYQRYIQDYLACVAAVDKSVGEILDYLKEIGLDKNTVVIYTSDQGFYLGEHGWFDKRWMFEESLRTPLLVMWPDMIKSGSISHHMVSNLDFAETFLDIAGGEIPGDMQGRSLLPLFKGEDPADWRKEHYYHYYEYPGWHSVKRHYGITTDRYKLIHFYYDVDEWELFDLQKDPGEMVDVYNDPAYETVKHNLHARLDQLRKQYRDSDSLMYRFLPSSATDSE